MDRYKEIERRLAEGRGLREIARALGCSRRLVREVRDGRGSPDTPKPGADPLWMSQLDWPLLVHDLSLGHLLKYLWEEKARHLTSYSNFWKQFHRKFPELRRASVTAREFSAGERIECDYAGKTLEWVDLTDGVLHQAYIFISVLGFSQLLFAWAAEDMKSRNWLSCHRRMFEAYGGVAHVTVPDCLKQGVTKCHIYDPDLNPAYAQLASHYSTAIVPARPGHPKDKGLAENAVNLVMRYVRFRYRRRRFTSLAEINQALANCIERINDRKHSRFRISRRERFEQCERGALKPLPAEPFEVAEWKEATLHADCYVQVEAVYYSAPHIHRHKRLRVKLTETQVEIFLKLERLAIHPRSRYRDGRRISNPEHFPTNSQAYYEATPQKLLSQRALSIPTCISSLSSSSTPMSTAICVVLRGWCAALPKSLTRLVESSPVLASSARSPRCDDITKSAYRTSRRYWRKLVKHPSFPMPSVKSYVAPAIPCFVTPAAPR